jgi:hypothetical protein
MASVYKIYILLLLLMPVILSCHSHKKTYASNCDDNITFKKVNYAHLLDSLTYYDQKYVEVTGRYTTGKERSALFSDSLYIIRPNLALWVNFSTDCPLYLSGTRVGFFDYDNGGFTRINNHTIRIRGKVDRRNHGYQKQYKGCIDHVSFIEL